MPFFEKLYLNQQDVHPKAPVLWLCIDPNQTLKLLFSNKQLEFLDDVHFHEPQREASELLMNPKEFTGDVPTIHLLSAVLECPLEGSHFMMLFLLRWM